MLISHRVKRLGLILALVLTLGTGVFTSVYAQGETETPVEDVTVAPTDEPVIEPTVAPTDEPAPEPTAEVTPEPPPIGDPGDALPPNTETPEDILALIWAALIAGAATVSGSVFVTALVNLLKVIFPKVTGDMLKNITSVVVWILYSLAIRFGVGTEVQGLATFIVPILTTVTPLIGVLIGSSKLYKAAVEAKAPIWGFQRKSPPAASP